VWAVQPMLRPAWEAIRVSLVVPLARYYKQQVLPEWAAHLTRRLPSEAILVGLETLRPRYYQQQVLP